MNQILSTGENNRKIKKEKKYNNPNKSELSTVIKVFAIILIIFSIFMIGSGAYALYKNDTNKKEEKLDIKPTISVENIEGENNTIILKVASKLGIENVTYNWNDEKEVTLNGNGGEYLEQKIKVPNGTNNFNIKALDTKGNETEFKKQYVVNSNINLEATENGKINIKYKGDTEVAYLTYRWDDGEEKKVEIKDLEFEYEIDVIAGRHTLTIVVVDINNNTETKVQETSGISIPEIEIALNENKTGYAIKVKDSIELKEIVITLDEDENKRFGQKLSGKEFKIELPFKKGENKIKVEVTNSDDQKAKKLMKNTVE